MSQSAELVQIIKQVAAQQQDNRFFAYGNIAQGSYDATTHRVKVVFASLRDDYGNPVISPWMPLGSPWVGNGYGMQAAPVGGEQCVVELISRQRGTHVCAYLVYNYASPAPGGLNAGEAILKHQSGSFIKFHANGDIETNTQGNVIVNSAASVNVTATGSATVTAPNINLGSSGETLLSALTSAAATLYNSHTHSGVQNGSGTTGVPNQQMGAGDMTTVVKVG